jgi:DNA-binding response OmpR family regulator
MSSCPDHVAVRVVAEPPIRDQIERALASSQRVDDHRPAAIVVVGLDAVVAERAAHPTLPLLATGLRRAEVAAALDAGADAAMSGVLRPAELRARLHALRRRVDPHVQVGERLVVDMAASLARLDGRPLALASGELWLLRQLASPPGRLCTIDELRRTAARGTRTIERRVARLRERLGDDGTLVVTVWGLGYRLGERPRV